MKLRRKRTAEILCAFSLLLALPSYAQTADSSPDTGAPQDWNFHFQMTVIGQGYPAFSGVNGPQSLNSRGQIRETISDTFFGGVRMPWSTEQNSTELYVNPEIDQGFGLSHASGVAGFPSGEAQKAGSDVPRINMARYFVRQTFGLGGERETVESVGNQLGGARDISRLTVSVGQMSIPDFFDNNSYSHDARSQFMNLALIDAGAYDYAADPRGYSVGAVFEYNQKDWALRYGYFFAPEYPNSPHQEIGYGGKGGHDLELEERYAIADQPGVFRVLGFANISNTGSYREALDNPSLNLNIAATRSERVKYGYVLNVEQALNDDLGLFSRYSWNDGQEEIASYTDIDQSLSAGASLRGTPWGRSDDTVGLAGAVNMLSQAHIGFLKAGGSTIMLGDGFLHYAPEDILEAYYNYRVFKPLSATLDYQFVANPGYNQSRGPANIFALRAHVEF